MKNRIIKSIEQFIPASLVFTVLFLLLRVYELILLKNRTGYEENITLLQPGLFGYDLAFACVLISCVLVIHIILSTILPRAAYVVSNLIFMFFLVLAFGLIQYFSSLLVPLSADVFGYALSDIFQTLHSSYDIKWTTVASLLTMLSLAIAGSWKLKRYRLFSRIPVGVTGGYLGILLTGWFFPLGPSSESFERDRDYDQAVNKTQLFLSSTTEYLWERVTRHSPESNGYPFIRRIDDTDDLGKHFRKSPTNPNFVFLIVEGLGRDFMGPGAAFGGFTPFLDSLSTQSLFWENFLSNAGRTFGALPSILGSLPYGHEGFMSYGTAMPDHSTLVSLLKPHGYTSSFFYGGNPNFDNQDLFLEYQGFDKLIDETKFPTSIGDKNPLVKRSSWGYSDREVFSFASRVLQSTTSPHVDVYLTLTTHEPFRIPDPAFEKKFSERLLLLDLEESKRKAIKSESAIFSCLLYTDHAIRDLFKYYASRKDFENTIFIITGDHRLVPFPMENKMKRFHVPLIIYSPLLKQPESFSSMAIHSDITPSLLNFLSNQYGLDFPQDMPFISGPLAADKSFSSELDIALIRNKNGTNDYVEGEYLLSDDRLYTILPNLDLEPTINEQVKTRLIEKLKKFKSNSIYACDNNRLDKKGYGSRNQMLSITAPEHTFIKSIGLDQFNPEQQFEKARQLSYDGDFVKSRAILKYVLNRSPNYHDARILLARTFGWDQQYDSAIFYIKQTIDRAPLYTDAFCAWADVAYWRGDHNEALSIIEKGLMVSEHDNELLARKARALMKLGKSNEANRLINDILAVAPFAETAIEVRRQLFKK